MECKTPLTAIVILNYNNVDETLACVRSVQAFSKEGSYSMCVVDNASKKEVVKAVREELSTMDGFVELSTKDPAPARLPRLTYLTHHVNEGYARGNNLGLRFFQQYKEPAYYLVLNNDVLFTEDIITPLVAWMESTPDAGVASPLLYSKTGAIDYNCARHEKRPIDLLSRAFFIGRASRLPWIRRQLNQNQILLERPKLLKQEVADIELPSGSCMLLRRNVFEACDFFDPTTFLYFEEDILWKKLQRQHHRVLLLPHISCIHLGANSISKSPSPFIRRCHAQSMAHYVDHYADVGRLFKWFFHVNLRFKLFIHKS